MSPTDYKQSAAYAAGTPTLNTAVVLSATYPSRPPVYWNYDLNRSARQHSQEMADFNYFAHNSLDGGSAGARIQSYYSLSGTWGENIAAGNLDPIATMHQWLCDQASAGAPCCNDGASCDGHRRNIMSASFRALGSGYGNNTSSTYRHYWTQDFGGTAALPTPPLVEGVHLLSTTQTRFIANFSAAAAAQSVELVLAGQPMLMTVELGTTTRGTWLLVTPRGTACRPYYFVATDSGGLRWRYPATGQLQTIGEGTCALEWTP